MFCTKCGSELRSNDKFCSECATPSAKFPIAPRTGAERLSRPLHDRKLAGVCAGLARYLSVDVTLVRVIAVILLFWPVPLMASVAYLVAWAIVPQDPLGVQAPLTA